MADSMLKSIIAELAQVEAKLKAQVEKLFGKIETTDFADEYAELQDVHQRLVQFLVDSVPQPEEEKPMKEKEKPSKRR
jgi:anion-transporting  ArsA/GET3 family ATPase